MQSDPFRYSSLRSRFPRIWIISLLVHWQTARCVSASQPSGMHSPLSPSLRSSGYLPWVHGSPCIDMGQTLDTSPPRKSCLAVYLSPILLHKGDGDTT